MTRKITEEKNITEKELGFDYYISGSDQIWNTRAGDANNAYFLPEISREHKISYAPSFGPANPNEQKNKLKIARYIKDYSAVSVREENGQKWVKELCGFTPQIVLDPTLLLEANDYRRIEDPAHGLKIQKNKYIFVYDIPLKMSRQKIRYLRKVSKQYSLPVVVWNPIAWMASGGKASGFLCPTKQTPGTFLHLVKNANLVLSSSFHGVVFSIIYRKNFWAVKEGSVQGKNDRLNTLFNSVCIKERWLDISDAKANMLDKVDYLEYNSKICAQRDLSVQYLCSALKIDCNKEEK
jgi:hypothetical protein